MHQLQGVKEVSVEPLLQEAKKQPAIIINSRGLIIINITHPKKKKKLNALDVVADENTTKQQQFHDAKTHLIMGTRKEKKTFTIKTIQRNKFQYTRFMLHQYSLIQVQR